MTALDVHRVNRPSGQRRLEVAAEETPAARLLPLTTPQPFENGLLVLVDVLARVEVDVDDLARLARPGMREAVLQAGVDAGFRWVTLDLAGYRSPEHAMRAALADDPA